MKQERIKVWIPTALKLRIEKRKAEISKQRGYKIPFTKVLLEVIEKGMDETRLPYHGN